MKNAVKYFIVKEPKTEILREKSDLSDEETTGRRDKNIGRLEGKERKIGSEECRGQRLAL